MLYSPYILLLTIQCIEGDTLHANLHLDIPGSHSKLCPGDKIKLSRFETDMWIVMYGWYGYGGNREVCGWYLLSCDDPSKIKPLSKPDMYDIVLITH